MLGGDAWFGSASQRMPRLTVRSRAHAPVVAEPDRVGRARHVDRPVALVPGEVHLVVARERVERRQVPRRRIQFLPRRQHRRQVGRRAVEGEEAGALDEPRAAVVHVDVLGADLEIVLLLVDAEVGAAGPVVLVQRLRIVVRRAERQARDAVLGRAEHRVLRRVGPVEAVVAALDLEDAVAALHHARPGAEHVGRVLGLIRRRRRMAAGREHLGVLPAPARSANREPVVQRQLIVDAHQEAALPVLVRNAEALGRQRRGVGEDRARLALVLVRPEEVDLVFDDRPAQRGADLLVRVRQHFHRHQVRAC